MSSAIEALGNAGPGVEFVALGKSWALSFIGPLSRAAFSSWCRVRARQRLQEDRDGLTPAEYAVEKADLRRLIDGGHYDWGTPYEQDAVGDGVGAFLDSDEGRINIVRILLQNRHGEVSNEDVIALMEDAPDEVGFALQEALELFPNWKAPLLCARAEGAGRTADLSELTKNAAAARATLDEILANETHRVKRREMTADLRATLWTALRKFRAACKTGPTSTSSPSSVTTACAVGEVLPQVNTPS